MSRFSAGEMGLPAAVTCPFCEAGDTELHSAFGSQLSVATYWCRRCGTAFEWFKREAMPGTGSTGAPARSRSGGTTDHARGPAGPDPAGPRK